MNRFFFAVALSFSGFVFAEEFNPSAIEVLLNNGQKNHSYRIELVVRGTAYGIQRVFRERGEDYETGLGPTSARSPFVDSGVLAEAKGRSMDEPLRIELDAKQLDSVASKMVKKHQKYAFQEAKMTDLEIRVVTVKSPANFFYREVRSSETIAKYSFGKKEWEMVTEWEKTVPAPFSVRYIE
jgi:hypothetical protein